MVAGLGGVDGVRLLHEFVQADVITSPPPYLTQGLVGLGALGVTTGTSYLRRFGRASSGVAAALGHLLSYIHTPLHGVLASVDVHISQCEQVRNPKRLLRLLRFYS